MFKWKSGSWNALWIQQNAIIECYNGSVFWCRTSLISFLFFTSLCRSQWLIQVQWSSTSTNEISFFVWAELLSRWTNKEGMGAGDLHQQLFRFKFQISFSSFCKLTDLYLKVCCIFSYMFKAIHYCCVFMNKLR